MSEFHFVTLKSLCKEIIDCPHSSPKWLSEGIPVVRNYNLKHGKINMSDLSYVDEKTYRSRIKRAVPEPGDVVISREAPMGVAAIIPEGFKCCMGQRLVLLKVDKDKCDPQYLLYALMSNFVQTQIHRVDLTGSIVSNLNIPDLEKLIIPVIDDQKKVADFVKLIDDKIEVNNALSYKLESLARMIYDYWFLQFDFPDENGRPYRSSGGKMVWNAELKREIPEGWEVVDINDVCSIVDCLHSKKPKYHFQNEKYYLLGLENITQDGYIDLSNKYYISKADYDEWTSRIEVHENDFVVTNAGRAGDIGKIPKNVICAIGRNITAIRPYQINPYYFRQFLKSNYMKEQVMSNLDRGSFFMSFNVKSIKKIKILIPMANVYKRACMIFKNIALKIEDLQVENQHLASLRDFLLPLLMNGQVTFKTSKSKVKYSPDYQTVTDLSMVAEHNSEYGKKGE